MLDYVYQNMFDPMVYVYKFTPIQMYQFYLIDIVDDICTVKLL